VTTDALALIIETHRGGRVRPAFAFLIPNEGDVMSDTLTKHNLFRPMPSKKETGADVTDRSARAIIHAESERRAAITARLRQARLENEATRAAAPSPADPRCTKIASRRRARASI
jgi:hypothetical protein